MSTAVCLLPGTELAFDSIPDFHWYAEKPITSAVAIFRQTEKDVQLTHHDVLEFAPDGQQVKLTQLQENQVATVLQLPAAPKTDAERLEQTRVTVNESANPIFSV